MDFVPNLTFVSTTVPQLGTANTKAVRAHITRANFTRRRRRLVRDYADQKERARRTRAVPVEEDDQIVDRDQAVYIQLPMFIYPGLDQKLNGKDASLINYCT